MKPYPIEVQAWLLRILYERFGCEFVWADMPDHAVRLSLASDESYIEISSDVASFIGSGTVSGCVDWRPEVEDWSGVVAGVLPVPGREVLPPRMIDAYQGGYRINYDILGLIYWMLSRSEEVGGAELDAHGRFPATSSHAYRHGYLERPIVDEWLCILGQVIQRLWPALELKQSTFSMKVSHDVDRPSRYGFLSAQRLVRAVGSTALIQRNLRLALLAPWIRLGSGSRLHPLDPFNTFDWIMDASEAHGLVSAFYFICGRTDVGRDANYEPEHPAIRDLMRTIHARGHEIGLHPSYGTYQAPESILAEANRLRKVCAEEGIHQDSWGGRMHYLRWQHPLTMRAWDAAGMDYDSTFSYADRPGFRCGTAFEYPAFDPVAGKALRLRVRPLIAMECTVMAETYMGLGTGSAALAKFTELKNACRAVKGCFTLLWHNSELNEAAKRDLYQAVLKA